MNLKQLEVFVAVAETGSFSKGAEACFITQSTVSQHVSSLEKEFGIPLLDRTGQGALPTEGGKVLLHQARQLLADARAVRERMRRFRGLDDANLRVGGSNIPGNYLIPAALPQLLNMFPGLNVTLLHGDTRETLDRIVHEEVEIGVVGGLIADDKCTFTPLARDELQLIVGREHRWFGQKSVLLDELLGEPFIFREPGSGTGKTVMDALQRSGIACASLTVRARLGSNEAVKHAVAGGLGISFLSWVSVHKEVERGELGSVAVEGLNLSRLFYLVRRAGRELSPAAAAFVEVMEKMMQHEEGR